MSSQPISYLQINSFVQHSILIKKIGFKSTSFMVSRHTTSQERGCKRKYGAVKNMEHGATLVEFKRQLLTNSLLGLSMPQVPGL
jgi:hypothetical protein